MAKEIASSPSVKSAASHGGQAGHARPWTGGTGLYESQSRDERKGLDCNREKKNSCARGEMSR